MTNNFFISICIPSYNRPETLYRLLKSIDLAGKQELEIVICEDYSPKRLEIRGVVEKFRKETTYDVYYKENKINLGFDKNLKELVRSAHGEWILFMGDDDFFVPGALDKLVKFLRSHSDLGYVLKSHLTILQNNKVEKFRYYDSTRFFEPGEKTYEELFRKSVFISGFIIRRDFALPFLVDDFDGTLLFQLYPMAEVVLRYPSAYFDEPLAAQHETRIPFFGTSETERDLYIPGNITVGNSLNFLSGFSKITKFLDNKYGFNSTAIIKKNMSKYFYPSLAIQRDRGLKEFLKYVKKLNEMGFNITVYYYLYTFFLIIFGKYICDNGIRIIKDILGRTPRL